MLLVMDIGNSNIVIGAFLEGALVHRFRISTHRPGTPDEYGNTIVQLLSSRGIQAGQIKATAIASVVPELDYIFDELCNTYLQRPARFVGRDITIPMPVLVDQPAEVGADRLVNAYAAWREYQKAMILVDLGTATTFDVVSDQGAYLGGAIAPGVEISKDALFRSAAKLTRVELDEPERAIGKNTKEAIQSGLYLGYVGLIDALVNRMRQELPFAAGVLATGGLAKFFREASLTIEKVDPDLTLKGLLRLHQDQTLGHFV